MTVADRNAEPDGDVDLRHGVIPSFLVALVTRTRCSGQRVRVVIFPVHARSVRSPESPDGDRIIRNQAGKVPSA